MERPQAAADTVATTTHPHTVLTGTHTAVASTTGQIRTQHNNKPAYCTNALELSTNATTGAAYPYPAAKINKHQRREMVPRVRG
jgi:hypothetical protein